MQVRRVRLNLCTSFPTVSWRRLRSASFQPCRGENDDKAYFQIARGCDGRQVQRHTISLRDDIEPVRSPGNRVRGGASVQGLSHYHALITSFCICSSPSKSHPLPPPLIIKPLIPGNVADAAGNLLLWWASSALTLLCRFSLPVNLQFQFLRWASICENTIVGMDEPLFLTRNTRSANRGRCWCAGRRPCHTIHTVSATAVSARREALARSCTEAPEGETPQSSAKPWLCNDLTHSHSKTIILCRCGGSEARLALTVQCSSRDVGTEEPSACGWQSLSLCRLFFFCFRLSKHIQPCLTRRPPFLSSKTLFAVVAQGLEHMRCFHVNSVRSWTWMQFCCICGQLISVLAFKRYLRGPVINSDVWTVGNMGSVQWQTATYGFRSLMATRSISSQNSTGGERPI